MGFWGKVVGGAIGGMVGGPLGAAVGVGFGSMFDEDEPSQANGFQGQPFGAEVQFFDDPDGRYYIVNAPLPDGTLIVAHLLNAAGNRYLRSRVETMADADGDFVVGGETVNNFAGFYIPSGAIAEPEGTQDILLEICAAERVGDTPNVLGCQRFTGDIHVTAAWSEAVHWRPLIGLCMMVAHADGKLLAEEVRAVRGILEEGLQIPKSESSHIRHLMKEEPSGSLDELVSWMHYRFPGVPLEALLSSLCDVSKADGDVAAAEVEVIRQVAIAYGVPEQDWPSVAEALDLQVSADLHLQYLTLLGLHQGASKSEVKSAYRTKVMQYHPDRVASLAPEFQELANRKTIELRVAYEQLLASFD